jgi:hypothetical protein
MADQCRPASNAGSDGSILRFIDKNHPRACLIGCDRVELRGADDSVIWTILLQQFKRLIANDLIEEAAGPGSGFYILSSKGFRIAHADDPELQAIWKAQDEKERQRRRLDRRIASFFRSRSILCRKGFEIFGFFGAIRLAWSLSK